MFETDNPIPSVCILTGETDMASYREQILTRLSHEGWQQHSVNPDPEEWWRAECWVLRSVRHHWGFEIHITFVVDPQFDGTRQRRGSAVWEVVASIEPLESWNDDRVVASLPLKAGDFSDHLDTFMAALESARSSI